MRMEEVQGCVLCKRAVSLKLRGSMHNGFVKSALCNGAECLALTKEDKRKLQTTY